MANTWDPDAPEPPERSVRINAGCSVCGRLVNWITFDPSSVPDVPIVCGKCAQALVTQDTKKRPLPRE